MVRPREFDEAAALEAAMQCFWSHGYKATSIRHLAKVMGITSASLYNAFGDKRSLYRRALEHYVERSFGDRVSRFEGRLPPRDAVTSFFKEIVERSLSDSERKGCMLVNSAVEVDLHDAESRHAIAEVTRQVEAFFQRCVAAGQRDETIACVHPPEDIARLLLGILLGIRVLARSRPERDLLEGLVRPVFDLLGGIRIDL